MIRPFREVPPCLACRHTPGHTALCPSTDPETTYYLRHPIPNGHRDWTPAGIRYTGTPARRTAVRALMSRTRWERMLGDPQLPMSPGLLINEILAGLGTAARTATRVGHTPNPAHIRTSSSPSPCSPWSCASPTGGRPTGSPAPTARCAWPSTRCPNRARPGSAWPANAAGATSALAAPAPATATPNAHRAPAPATPGAHYDRRADHDDRHR